MYEKTLSSFYPKRVYKEHYYPLGIAIKNFLNGYYIKECSKKMRAGHKNKAKKGTLSVRGHYGYLVEEGKYIPDPITAPIVKDIFKRFLSGERVVNILECLICSSNKNLDITV